MRRLSDEEILGRYGPHGIGPAPAAGERVACARGHCSGAERAPGARGYRWTLRHGKGAAIELCLRCHRELATIASGG
ncbi:MAG: hypothetical protein ACREEA_12345 [Stellaceae bacterium]